MIVLEDLETGGRRIIKGGACSIRDDLGAVRFASTFGLKSRHPF